MPGDPLSTILACVSFVHSKKRPQFMRNSEAEYSVPSVECAHSLSLAQSTVEANIGASFGGVSESDLSLVAPILMGLVRDSAAVWM